MDRNPKNQIIWEPPEQGELLAVSPRRNEINVDEVKNLFELEFQSSLTEEPEGLLSTSSVQIAGSFESGAAEIVLQIEGEEPYTLFKNGERLAINLQAADFPYTDSNVAAGDGEIRYRIEDRERNENQTVVNA